MRSAKKSTIQVADFCQKQSWTHLISTITIFPLVSWGKLTSHSRHWTHVEFACEQTAESDVRRERKEGRKNGLKNHRMRSSIICILRIRWGNISAWCIWETQTCAQRLKVKLKQSRYRPGLAQRVPGSYGSQITWQRHRMVVRLSALRNGRLYP